MIEPDANRQKGIELTAVGNVRLLEDRLAADGRCITRGAFYPRIDVANHDRSARRCEGKRRRAADHRAAPVISTVRPSKSISGPGLHKELARKAIARPS